MTSTTLSTSTLRKILTTDKQLFMAVRCIAMSIRKRDGEYRVNYRNGSESTAYYTNDRADAYETAKRMREESKQREERITEISKAVARQPIPVWGIPDKHFDGKVWVVYKSGDAFLVGWELDDAGYSPEQTYQMRYETIDAAKSAATRNTK